MTACARADPEQQHQHAQRADRGVGQDALEIRFEHRPVRAAQHRHCAGERDGSRPERGAAEHRRQPGDQIDARLDHRRRVQIGADRGRRLHRVGQPEVEGELRRLGERGEQHEADDGPYIGWPARRSPFASSVGEATCRPPARAARRRPAAPGRHPPVTSSAWRAARRASWRSCSNPISRYDVKPVSSQNTNRASRLSLSTTPSMEPMKANSETWNRPAWGCARDIGRHTARSTCRSPVIRIANSSSVRRDGTTATEPRLGAHGTDTVTGPWVATSQNT